MSKNKIVVIICGVVVIALCVVLVCVLPDYEKDTERSTETDAETVEQTDTTTADEPDSRDYSFVNPGDSVQTDVIQPESEQFSWYKKPFLKASEMQVVKNCMYRNSVYKYIDAEYVVYYDGDKCGVANSFGEIISEPVYTSPGYCPEEDGIVFNDHGTAFYFETKSFGYTGGHGGRYPDFIYDRNSGKCYLIGGSEGPDEPCDYDESGIYIVYEAYVKADEYNYDFFVEENGGYVNYSCNKTGKLGLYNNGEIVIPFEYITTTEISDGVVGMYDGSEWTYFTVDGKVIMENVPKNNDTFLYLDGMSEVTERAVFNYSCGCVPVKKDGKWGYMDKNGNMIVDAVFDYALPAYENRAWVCVDHNYWGIIEINK